MRLFGTQEIKQNELFIGGMSVSELKKQFGTPLYVMDVAHMKAQSKLIKESFSHPSISTGVMYASKAFLNLAMVKFMQDQDYLIEVVSEGELYTVEQAGYPLHNVFFHGNAKTAAELDYAYRSRVGTIIIDNHQEYVMLQAQHPGGFIQRVMVRLNPLIESETHEYIQTTMNDSKFGVYAYDESTLALLRLIQEDERFTFVGIHSHIGSQIVNPNTFYAQVESMMGIVRDYAEKGISIQEVNLGGGFGVAYTESDHEVDVAEVLPNMLKTIALFCEEHDLTIPKVYIEPARSIVANAGTTLYTVHSTKTTPSGKQFCFVDGSMADHIRTVLYQATYDAVVANRATDPEDTTYTIGGRACESGDIIVRSVKLASPQAGDLIAVSTTGAYHYSMASNYNRFTKPAVVFVENGKGKVVVKRETLDDLLRNDVK